MNYDIFRGVNGIRPCVTFFCRLYDVNSNPTIISNYFFFFSIWKHLPNEQPRRRSAIIKIRFHSFIIVGEHGACWAVYVFKRSRRLNIEDCEFWNTFLTSKLFIIHIKNCFFFWFVGACIFGYLQLFSNI